MTEEELKSEKALYPFAFIEGNKWKKYTLEECGQESASKEKNLYY